MDNIHELFIILQNWESDEGATDEELQNALIFTEQVTSEIREALENRIQDRVLD